MEQTDRKIAINCWINEFKTIFEAREFLENISMTIEMKDSAMNYIHDFLTQKENPEKFFLIWTGSN